MIPAKRKNENKTQEAKKKARQEDNVNNYTLEPMLHPTPAQTLRPLDAIDKAVDVILQSFSTIHQVTVQYIRHQFDSLQISVEPVTFFYHFQRKIAAMSEIVSY